MSGKNTLYFGEELSGVSIEEDYIIGDKLGEFCDSVTRT